jgi:hypothetical protein
MQAQAQKSGSRYFSYTNCRNIINQLKCEGLDEHELSVLLTIPFPSARALVSYTHAACLHPH